MFDKDSLEAIELMVDLHNDVNEDALQLISEYYLDITNPIETKITEISEKEISLLISLSDTKINKAIQFPEEAKDANEVSTFFYTALNQARSKAPEDYPITRVESLIKKTLNLKTYITKVIGKRIISSNILEITFEGGLEDLPNLKNDAFMYFIVHREIGHKYPEGFTIQDFKDLGSAEKNPYSAAYYTIRNFRKNAIDVWFVLHDHPGPLAMWAEEVVEGCEVAIWGPRTTFTPPNNTKEYLFIADETAQPAVLASIENLGNIKKYKCFFETQDESTFFKYDDEQDAIDWTYRKKQPAGKGTELIKKIENLEIDTNAIYVFGAGEAKQISTIRKIFKKKYGLKSDQMSFTGYWRKTAD
tara:strand:- start:438 stop:1514 length:1077 start_codon:yes stop_codon:yes gene_type:complete